MTDQLLPHVCGTHGYTRHDWYVVIPFVYVMDVQNHFWNVTKSYNAKNDEYFVCLAKHTQILLSYQDGSNSPTHACFN